MKRFVTIAVASAATMLGLFGIHAPAQAKVAGRNGQIVFVRAAGIGPVTFRVNSRGHHRRRLFPGSSDNPRWSPDGRSVAIEVDPFAAVIVNVETGSHRALPQPDPSIGTGCFWAWSPDRTRLACAGAGITDPKLNGIYTIRSADGGGLERVTSNRGGADLPSDFSPDGRSIVFTRSDRQGNVLGLFVVRVNGTGLRQLTPPGMIVTEAEGSWSPNGRQIVFAARPGPDNRLAVWVINANGSGLRRIPIEPRCGGAFSNVNSIGCFSPRWSPDGTMIVFAQSSKGATVTNVYTVEASGGPVFQVTHSGRDDNPDWGAEDAAVAGG